MLDKGQGLLGVNFFGDKSLERSLSLLDAIVSDQPPWGLGCEGELPQRSDCDHKVMRPRTYSAEDGDGPDPLDSVRDPPRPVGSEVDEDIQLFVRSVNVLSGHRKSTCQTRRNQMTYDHT